MRGFIAFMMIYYGALMLLGGALLLFFGAPHLLILVGICVVPTALLIGAIRLVGGPW